ncbi:MAG: glycine--tRNA ligase [Chitinophagales bacterium]
MKNSTDDFKTLIAHCKEYGYVFPSSEVYDGLSAVYDYGPYGVELKNNIKEYWWKAMVQMHENIVGLDSAIFMHPLIWKASGHVDAFSDPMIDNKDSKKRYRADVLIEEHLAKIDEKNNKDVEKAKKRFGDSFNEAQFRATNARVLKRQEERDAIHQRFVKALGSEDLNDLKTLIEDCQIADPEGGSRNWTDVRQFNLMFSTQFGATSSEGGDNSNKVYLRPETAQGIFVNFLNVQKTTRQKIPFGIAQIGKAFRNEIVARQFIFRMREFEQMEMQFFVKPGTEMEWYHYWKEFRMNWHKSLFPAEKLQYHDHDKLAHYANAALDIEFEFPFGFKEIEGIHSRTDFDLGNHQELSGRKMQYFDPELGESYVPYVVETSIGVDRTFFAVVSHALQEEEVPDAKGNMTTRVVMKIPAVLAPVKVAVLPLTKDEALTDKAREIFNQLRWVTQCQYDEKDSIGRRYRRQDAIGTPFCVTLDFETLEDGQVTVRDRDTMDQVRIPIAAIEGHIAGKLDFRTLIKG